MSKHFKQGSVGAILVALIAIILLGWAVWYINTREDIAPVINNGYPPVATTTQDTSVKSYQNTQAGYTVKYPKELTLQENVDVKGLIKAASGAMLTYPASYFTNTTISPTQTLIALVATSTSCASLLPAQERQLGSVKGTTIINGEVFTTIKFSEGAAGHSYQTNAYYTTRNGLCYVLTLTTDTLNPGNYAGTPAEVATKEAANIEARKALVTVFDTIAQSFTFTNTMTATTVIKIPLLIDAGNTRFEGVRAACDKIVYVDKTIAPTTQPLTAVYKELFDGKYPWPYTNTTPGNFIPTQTKISFVKVVTVDGVAKVYLKGQGGPFAGMCDEPRMQMQLFYGAMQFPNIKSVEYYLNDRPTALTFNENE